MQKGKDLLLSLLLFPFLQISWSPPYLELLVGPKHARASAPQYFILSLARGCICQYPFADDTLTWGQKKDTILQ